MIVLYKDYCRIAFGLFKHGIAKALIDGFICLPITAGKMRPRIHNMAQGPERFIGQAIIIAIFFLPGKPDTPEHIFRPFFGEPDSIPTVNNRPVC